MNLPHVMQGSLVPSTINKAPCRHTTSSIARVALGGDCDDCYLVCLRRRCADASTLLSARRGRFSALPCWAAKSEFARLGKVLPHQIAGDRDHPIQLEHTIESERAFASLVCALEGVAVSAPGGDKGES
jgi:hypothetical protein